MKVEIFKIRPWLWALNKGKTIRPRRWKYCLETFRDQDSCLENSELKRQTALFVLDQLLIAMSPSVTLSDLTLIKRCRLPRHWTMLAIMVNGWMNELINIIACAAAERASPCLLMLIIGVERHHRLQSTCVNQSINQSINQWKHVYIASRIARILDAHSIRVYCCRHC